MINGDSLQVDKINRSCENYKYANKTGATKFAKIGNWLEKQSSVFKNEADKKVFNKPNFKRGEIIKVDFGINMGSELSNTHFAIVLNSDDNNHADNLTVIPLTSKKGYKRLNVGNILHDYEKNGKYSGDGYALLTQITTISKMKIFNTNVRSFCSKEIMNYITENIINYFSK